MAVLHRFYIVQFFSDNGVKEEINTENGQQSCLTDEQIIHLCSVGIKVRPNKKNTCV